MPNLVSESIFAQFMAVTLDFDQANVAISQTAVALKMNAGFNATVVNALDVVGMTALANGSIFGLTIQTDTNKTAGVLTVTPTINGTAIAAPAALVAVPLVNATQKAFVLTAGQQAGARFVAGDLIGVKMTTDGSFAPTTMDIRVRLFVVYEFVQP